MKQRKVLVLNQFAVPKASAGGTRHVELFERLQGWEPLILAGRRSLYGQSMVEDEGILVTVPVTPFKGNGLSRIINWASYMLGAGIRSLFGRRAQAVYGSSPHLGSALVGLCLSRIWRCPFVLEVRDLWPQILADTNTISPTSKLYRLLVRLELFLYAKADRIVVLAEGTAEDIAAKGVDQDKIVFIPNGAEPADFVVSQNKEQLRTRFGFGDDKIVVYAGAHGSANGLDLVIDAAEELEADNVPVKIVLIGDGIEKPALMAEVEKRQIGNIRFMDAMAKNEIPLLFAASDIGLHSLADVPLFHRAVSPNKIYDYMASGLPVLTNTPGEVARLVATANSGLAVEPTEMAAGIKKLVQTSDDKLGTYGSNGIAFMEANRSRRALSAQLEELLDSVLAP